MIKYGSIEAGGTKFVCAVSDADLTILERESFPTTTPEETMALVVTFFKEFGEGLKGIGVGSFGPIDINKKSETHGFITSTPKLAWQQFDLLSELKKHFDVPMAFTTDVNAAAYGEYTLGQGKDKDSLVYFTVGTGVGGGAIQNGNFVEGFSHPEMGHMLIQPHSEDDFEGVCPFHGNCLEGMAAGPSIEKRFGVKGQDLPEDHPFWEIEATYIAQCAYNTTLILSPEIIVFGGGVMHQQHMMDKVHAAFSTLINGYVNHPNVNDYIVTPALGDNAGTLGCLSLAKDL